MPAWALKPAFTLALAEALFGDCCVADWLLVPPLPLLLRVPLLALAEPFAEPFAEALA